GRHQLLISTTDGSVKVMEPGRKAGLLLFEAESGACSSPRRGSAVGEVGRGRRRPQARSGIGPGAADPRLQGRRLTFRPRARGSVSRQALRIAQQTLSMSAET